MVVNNNIEEQKHLRDFFANTYTEVHCSCSISQANGLKTIEKQIEQYRNLKQDAKSIKEDRELTAALIDRLIDRVELLPDNQITVKYKFRSEFQNCEEVLNRCRNM